MKQQLILENVSIAYGKNTIISNCSFSLSQGRILSLLGSSGCGKSTLLKAIAGLLPIQTGKISLGETLIAAPELLLTPEKNKVGMIFQDYALFPHLTVLDNVAFGLYKLAAKEREALAHKALTLVQLEKYSKRYPHELSGGQQQRVAIARTMVCKPSIILFDEPFSNLDVTVRQALAAEIKTLLKDQKITAIFVTHDKNEAFAMADEIAIIDKGEIAQLATPQDIYDNPNSYDIANFLGSGIVLPVTTTDAGWQTPIGNISQNEKEKVLFWGETENKTAVYLRPHQIKMTADEQGDATIDEVNFRGDLTVYHLHINENKIDILSSARFDAGQRVCLSFNL